MAQGHHHIKLKAKSKTFEKVMYVVALISPVMTIPQLITVWQGHTTGVSLATWGGYAAVSLLWLIYGLKQKDKPLALTQFLLLVLDAAIALAVILYH